MKKSMFFLILAISIVLNINRCIKEEKKGNEIVSSGVINGTKFASVPNELFIEQTYTTRMTSFYSGDECNTGSITASGLGENDFDINEYGWYTYQDKLVIATASNRLGYTDMRNYNLYDEITIIIDGERYEGIVLDRCGACMKYNRIDLFVSSGQYAVDKYVEVVE